MLQLILVELLLKRRLQYKLAKFLVLCNNVLAVLPRCQLNLDIQLFLVVYVETFLVLVCSKIN